MLLLRLLALAGSLLSIPAMALGEPAADSAPAAPAAPVVEPGRYVRTVNDEQTLVSTLEVAIRSFTMKDPSGAERTITLVGAVHIGDAEYYAQLQEFLDKQDLVLYEGVKPPGAGDFDASMPDEKKAAATKRRLEFLLKAMDRHRAQHGGEYPASVDALAQGPDPRLKKILSGLTTDAWGRAIVAAAVVTPATEDKAERATMTLTSAGPDGDPATAADNIVVTGKPLKKGQSDPEAAKVRPGMQQKLADTLGLTFQMQGINYDRPNFRPSDLSMDQIQERIAEAGGNADMLFAMLDGSSLPARMAGLLLDLIKGSKTMTSMVKMILVQTLGEADDLMDGAGEMPAMRGFAPAMKVILHDRNEVVLKDLDAVLEKEPQFKTIAAFYGAGHLAAIEKHLLELGAKPVGERWLGAIRVDGKAAGLSEREIRMFQGMAKRQVETMKKMRERAK